MYVNINLSAVKISSVLISVTLITIILSPFKIDLCYTLQTLLTSSQTINFIHALNISHQSFTLLLKLFTILQLNFLIVCCQKSSSQLLFT